MILYTTCACFLGRMLVAATARGICFLCFGDTDAELLAALAAEFPRAELSRDDERLRKWSTALEEHLGGRVPEIDLPLDAAGTPFQQRVWAELRRIPSGQTRTYTQVAEAIGQTSAVRAAAHACATNPVSLLIPCHRVVRRDGSLGGYRWGLARKAALQEREARLKQR